MVQKNESFSDFFKEAAVGGCIFDFFFSVLHLSCQTVTGVLWGEALGHVSVVPSVLVSTLL